MNAQEIIAGRRDGRTHTEEELSLLARGAASGEIPDYQLSAWLMAAYLNPLSDQEAAWLTLAMADSGERLNLAGLPRPWVDKHSTGGVGDKTTIVLLPLLAACGLSVVKMSGRGLGITGGTVDKLASVPGFRLDLRPEEMVRQAARIGLALTGQTPALAPADKVLYALRDATATVASMPLIASSILSKKIAGGAEVVLLDVKCGSGAFMPDLPAARELASLLKRIGELCGLRLRIAITDMSQPLGAAVGNSLEVAEALRVLDPARPFEDGSPTARFQALCGRLAREALSVAGRDRDPEAALRGGKAREKAREWFAAQGADPDIVEHPDRLAKAPVRLEVAWRPSQTAQGWICRCDAGVIGQAAVDLGGGRRQKEDPVDPAVGIELARSVGSPIAPGDLLATIHASSDQDASRAEAAVREAIEVSGAPVEPPPLVHEII